MATRQAFLNSPVWKRYPKNRTSAWDWPPLELISENELSLCAAKKASPQLRLWLHRPLHLDRGGTRSFFCGDVRKRQLGVLAPEGRPDRIDAPPRTSHPHADFGFCDYPKRWPGHFPAGLPPPGLFLDEHRLAHRHDTLRQLHAFPVGESLRRARRGRDRFGRRLLGRRRIGRTLHRHL